MRVHEPRHVRSTSSPTAAVLFVNIGWAEKYDGKEPIRGNHGYLRDHPNDNSEHSAFLADSAGVYSCGIGRGSLSVPRLDIVFVARKEEHGGHYAVGLYRDAWWTADGGSDAKPWVRGHTRTAQLIRTEDRLEVTWPGHMDMRRWARRAGGKGREHQHLYVQYQEIRSLLERTGGSAPSPIKTFRPVRPSLLSGPEPKSQLHASPLAPRVDTDLLVLKSGLTEVHQRRHNSMTNALRGICRSRGLTVVQGIDAASRYDALIHGYQASERDLLIEVKTSIEPPFCRMAVGQLFDYRRPLPNRHATDLGVLFPEAPGEHVRAFLADVGVKALWFAPDMSSIEGDVAL